MNIDDRTPRTSDGEKISEVIDRMVKARGELPASFGYKVSSWVFTTLKSSCRA